MHAYSLRIKLTIKLVKKIWIICQKYIPLKTLFGYEPNDIIFVSICVPVYHQIGARYVVFFFLQVGAAS
jgi:hypothetical protein